MTRDLKANFYGFQTDFELSQQSRQEQKTHWSENRFKNDWEYTFKIIFGHDYNLVNSTKLGKVLFWTGATQYMLEDDCIGVYKFHTKMV